MRQQAANRPLRHLRMGVPAVVLGTLASTFTGAPAHAEVVSTGPVEQRSPLTTGRLSPTAATAETYTVRSGDTVSAIAQRHGLRTVDVLAWNGLGWRSVIHPGQTLRLTPPPAAAPATPAPAPQATAHTVVRGDTISAIAKKYGTTVDAVLAANGLSRASIIYPGQKIAVAAPSAPAAAAPVTTAPSPQAAVHTVVRGDTISAIAQKYGTTVDAVLAANGLSRASIIYPGQKIATVAPAAASTTAAAQKSAQLDAEQAANAALIIRIGRELGVSDRGIAIALATSMVESWMRNLDWGDRDSLGLFQQRPSTGWGTPEQIRDPERSIRVFYGGPNDPNGSGTRGLLDVDGWEGKDFSAAAQAVQISAYPERYGQWETAAYEWLRAYG